MSQTALPQPVSTSRAPHIPRASPRARSASMTTPMSPPRIAVNNPRDATEPFDYTLQNEDDTIVVAIQRRQVTARLQQSPSNPSSRCAVEDAEALPASTPPTSSSSGPSAPSPRSQSSAQPPRLLTQQRESFQRPQKPTLEIKTPRTPTMRNAEIAGSPTLRYTPGGQASPTSPGSVMKGLGQGISAAGQKRTASGAIKPQSMSVPASPMDGAFPGHSRESSASSAGNRISEMSAQLKARLSYALIKVQNGWQSKTLDEVESIYSHQTSPTSSTSTLHGNHKVLASPRTVLAKHKFDTLPSQTQEYNYKRTDGTAISSPPGFRHSRSTSSINGGSVALNGALADAARYLANPTSASSSIPQTNTSRTYESFWRDHSSNPVAAKLVQARAAVTSSTPSLSGSQPSSQTDPSSQTTTTTTTTSTFSPSARPPTALAPPANILPSRNPRRTPHSAAPAAPPPPIPTNLSNLSNASYTSQLSSSSTIPATPPPPQQHRRRALGLATTPQQQKTAMEQDAVETLMFMSSPGNSNIVRSSQGGLQSPRFYPPQSPLKRGFGSRLGGEDEEDDRDPVVVRENVAAAASKAAVYLRNASQGGGGRRRRTQRREDDEIDRMLDGMGDSSSDGEL